MRFCVRSAGASQEHKIKPKKFAQTDIDTVILGHTNEPEFRKLQSNEFMEALRDRTIKIDIPYVTKLSEEIKIYEKTTTSGGCGEAYCAAYARNGRHVGRDDPPGRTQASRADDPAETQAL
ncbi:MAG: hypothetical protein R3C12_18945 [Planctomycetaceae bacterium]